MKPVTNLFLRALASHLTAYVLTSFGDKLSVSHGFSSSVMNLIHQPISFVMKLIHHFHEIFETFRG